MPARRAALTRLVTRDLEQAAVHRVRDGLLLHRGVHDHALQLGRLDRADANRRLDRGLEHLLQARFAHGRSKATDLRGVARRAVLVVVHPTEELPQHVLAPARNEFFVAEVEAVLEVQQARHQSDGQTRPTGVAAARPSHRQARAEQIDASQAHARAIPALEHRRQRGLDPIPRQPRRQHRQRIVQVDHRVDARAEKIAGLHPRIPQKSGSAETESEGTERVVIRSVPFLCPLPLPGTIV
jgi:hypothetical protein